MDHSYRLIPSSGQNREHMPSFKLYEGGGGNWKLGELHVQYAFH